MSIEALEHAVWGNVDWDKIKPLFEQLKSQPTEEKELEKVLALVTAVFKVGDIVHVKGTSYIGVIHGFNTSLGGFYPGVRYPIFVKITKSENPKRANVPGSVFEYDLSQVVHFKQRYYKVNAGPRAVDNGAIYPLSKMFAIAEVADQKVLKGQYYGDDYLTVPLDEGKRKAVEELLTEEKLIWEIVDSLPSHISQ